MREVLMGHMVADDMAAGMADTDSGMQSAGMECAHACGMRRKCPATEPAAQASAEVRAGAAETHATAAEMCDPATAEAASTEATTAEMAAAKPATTKMAAAATKPAAMAAAAEATATPVPAATATATARQRRGCDRGTGESDRGDRREHDIAHH
jgi:hypothetical protein